MAEGERFEHGSVLGGKTRADWVSSQWKSTANYLLHDPEKAKTSERVAWTHTLNLANDHVRSAVNEMLWTYRAADQLKRLAGGAIGGRELKNPVKHFSLSWAPSDAPTREQTIDAAQHFLRHLGWQEHQAVLVAHRDKNFSHVHVMLNVVNPSDGRALNTAYERARASDWAFQFERNHQQIYCRERLKPLGRRAPSPTRAAWMKWKSSEKEYAAGEQVRVRRAWTAFPPEDRPRYQSAEWWRLKRQQRHARMAYMAEGKAVFKRQRNEVFSEVRDQFRGDWRRYYAAQRQGCGTSHLAEMKADILARQNAVLDQRRDAVCKTLREVRDRDYRLLLDRQKDQRACLSAGLEVAPVLRYAVEIGNVRKFPEKWPAAREKSGQAAAGGQFPRAKQEVCTTRTAARVPRYNCNKRLQVSAGRAHAPARSLNELRGLAQTSLMIGQRECSPRPARNRRRFHHQGSLRLSFVQERGLLLASYAAKIAAAYLTARRNELPAIIAAIRSEQDAALKALNFKMALAVARRRAEINGGRGKSANSPTSSKRPRIRKIRAFVARACRYREP
ncbi:MAG: relaxase/mobilization nuclease domain-containing protein [Xanthobacteraceae bacterium]